MKKSRIVQESILGQRLLNRFINDDDEDVQISSDSRETPQRRERDYRIILWVCVSGKILMRC